MYRAQLEAIPGGKAGLVAKMRRMRQLVETAKRDPNFRADVLDLVASVPEKDHTGEIERLLQYTRRSLRYVRDPWSPDGIELFVDPRTLLHDIGRGVAAGDCDDHVLLASAMLETVGYPTRYVVGGLPPDNYRHVWLEVQHPKKGWLPAELTKKDWPTFRDPAGKFPLVERYTGQELGDMKADFYAKRRRDDLRQARSMRQSGASRAERLQAKALLRAQHAGKMGDARAMPVGAGITPGTGRNIAAEFQRQAFIERKAYGRGPYRAAQRFGTSGKGGIAQSRRQAAARGGRRGGRAQLGELPPSAWNVRPAETIYDDSVPSDHLRAQAIREMFPRHSALHYAHLLGFDGVLQPWEHTDSEQLAGFLKKLGKSIKRGARSVKKVGRRIEKEAARSSKKVVKETKRGLVNYGPEAAAAVATVFGGPAAGTAAYGIASSARGAYLAKKAADSGDLPPDMIDPGAMVPYGYAPQYPPQPQPPVEYLPVQPGPSLPASTMSGLYGPSFVEMAQGFALPEGWPDEVAYDEIGEQEGWDRPMPGAAMGSYVPTPEPWEFPNAPRRDVFDVPATGVSGGDVDPGFGMGYGTEPLFGAPVSDADIEYAFAGANGLGEDMENTFGSLGAESWLTQLAQSAANQFLDYQKARFTRKAIEKGYLPAPPPPPPPPPAPRAAPPPPAPPPPPIIIQAPPREQPAPRAGGGVSPAMLAAVGGGLALLLLMKR